MNILNIYHHHGVIPEGAVYIGRFNAKFGLPESRWHNPFILKDPKDREEVFAKYQAHLDRQIATGAVTVEDLLELSGKDLVCFCAPKRCHGEAIAAKVLWAESLKSQPSPDQEVSAAPSSYRGRWRR